MIELPEHISDTPYQQGYDAATAGRPESANPYDRLSSEHGDWQCGWEDGQSDLYRE